MSTRKSSGLPRCWATNTFKAFTVCSLALSEFKERTSELGHRHHRYSHRRLILLILFGQRRRIAHNNKGRKQYKHIACVLLSLNKRILYCTVLYCVVLCCATVPYPTVPYCTVVYYNAKSRESSFQQQTRN